MPSNACGNGTARTLAVTVTVVDCSGYLVAKGVHNGPNPCSSCEGGDTYATLISKGFSQTNQSLCVHSADQSTSSTWNAAPTLCAALNTGGQTGWRLPNIAELGNLQSNCNTYGLNQDIDYWSSTERDGSNAWSWAYKEIWSHTFYGYKNYPYYVRCVKSL
jgi:hypothetical protein